LTDLAEEITGSSDILPY